MPVEVTFRKNGREESVVVRSVELDGGIAKMYGFDPSFCPEGFEDAIVFYSHELTALLTIENSADVELVKAAPTDESVPEPEVTF